MASLLEDFGTAVKNLIKVKTKKRTFFTAGEPLEHSDFVIVNSDGKIYKPTTAEERASVIGVTQGKVDTDGTVEVVLMGCICEFRRYETFVEGYYDVIEIGVDYYLDDLGRVNKNNGEYIGRGFSSTELLLRGVKK